MLLAGCGTSKWTDTNRTATEQLLISDSMDRAVSRLDFSALAGKTVYLDDSPLRKATDSEYLSSALRQHMLASGCILKDKRDDADYVVEARAGAVGTDRHDVMYGIPAVDIPAIIPVSGIGIPTKTPEMPLVKKTTQRAVTKIAVFAYNRKTGRPVWQSGAVPVESQARAIWVFGAGPFQHGTIYEGTELAGDKISIPLINFFDKAGTANQHVSVADEAFFVEPERYVAQNKSGDAAKSASAKNASEGSAAEPPARVAKRPERDGSSSEGKAAAKKATAKQTPTAEQQPSAASPASGTQQPQAAQQPAGNSDPNSPSASGSPTAGPAGQSPASGLPAVSPMQPSLPGPQDFKRLPPTPVVPLPALPFPDSSPTSGLPYNAPPPAPGGTTGWPANPYYNPPPVPQYVYPVP